MKGRIILALLIVLVAIPAMGQGRQVLADGIAGRDRVERLQFIQVFSLQSDTCFVVSDSLGHFEVDPDLMLEMRGNVYLKPIVSKPKPKLTLVDPFDSVDFYRQGRERYLSQNQFFESETNEDVFFFDPDVTILREASVKARKYGVVRDKVTGYLDSLILLASPEWVCEHGFLNDWHGYSHHPKECVGCQLVAKEHLAPKRGEVYHVVKYVPWPGHPVREFYEPDELDLASPTPDYRNLLQWRPAVLTDENGIAEIPFAASDVNTEFIGLVEAVDGLGLIGARTFTFRVYK
ncbi:MAG: hypothetical protein J6Y63_03670 [Bacteroidales bacterium]|nr:hypothetical protein [Bacteroidales bacterium]